VEAPETIGALVSVCPLPASSDSNLKRWMGAPTGREGITRGKALRSPGFIRVASGDLQGRSGQCDASSDLPCPALSARRTGFAGTRGCALLAPGSVVLSLQDTAAVKSFPGVGRQWLHRCPRRMLPSAAPQRIAGRWDREAIDREVPSCTPQPAPARPSAARSPAG
jgi:hypothetical protein